MPVGLHRPAVRATGLMLTLCLSPLSLLMAQQTNGAAAPVSSNPPQKDTPQQPVPDEAAELTSQLSAIAGEETATSANREVGPIGVVPLTRGFNLALASTSQHDAAGGWSNVLSPTIAYRFNQHFSLNATMSEYPYIEVVTTTVKKNAAGVVTKTTTDLEKRYKLLSDTTVNGSFDARTPWFDYNLTGTLGIPTGDDSDGLGAGQFTYGVISHFEHPFGDYFTPDVELGLDDNANLLTPRVLKSFTVIGNSAHFQAGVAVNLPWNVDFETDAYEELPVGSVTILSTTTKGKKGKQITATQESAGEDNGFTNQLDIPLNPHMTLSGFYNRSLRNHDDTAGFTLTFLLRSVTAQEHAAQ